VTLRIERLVTSGTFSLDGGTWDVDNNVWIVGDDKECVVIDPAHDAVAVANAAMMTTSGRGPSSRTS
jgi:glyoxylase-like metal-dependent hydrolase (beta-lactamase superfamily II)